MLMHLCAGCMIYIFLSHSVFVSLWDTNIRACTHVHRHTHTPSPPPPIINKNINFLDHHYLFNLFHHPFVGNNLMHSPLKHTRICILCTLYLLVSPTRHLFSFLSAPPCVSHLSLSRLLSSSLSSCCSFSWKVSNFTA